MNAALTVPTRPKRNFLPEDFKVTEWNELQPYFDDLKSRSILSKGDLDRWMSDRSELEAVLEEDAAWRYIKMTIDTTDEDKANAYTHFVTEIHPKMAPYDDQFNKLLVGSSYTSELVSRDFEIYLRGVRKAIELFREANIELSAKATQEAQKYGAISGAQSVEINGEEVTMQRAAMELKNEDRTHRKSVFEKMLNRRLDDKEKLDELFDVLKDIRNEIAKNAGFDNFRDYMFESMGRFDYTKQDCIDFHNSIQEEIVPIVTQFQADRKAALGFEKLKPYDMEVDPENRGPLKPFENGDELLEKSIKMFYNIDTYFGECLETMKEMGHLDLVSKKGKSPGGYNYPLYEIGVPFIFMNAVGTQRDLITMVHEGGHAVHSFLSRGLKLTAFKSLPSEVAELASMSMELITMDQWGVFYETKEDLVRAKKNQLETMLKILPWVAIVDKFQHWIYTNPNHTLAERSAKWNAINDAFSGGLVDWSDYPDAKANSWHRQLHIFEVPFYYIEYGMAQLGAIAVWRNYKENPEKAIQQYKDALALGYTKSIPEIYEAAGIKFDFSKSYVKELADFVKSEIEKL